MRTTAVCLTTLIATGCWSENYAADSHPDLDRPRTDPPTPPPKVDDPPPTGTDPKQNGASPVDGGDLQLTVIPGPVAICVRRGAPHHRLLAERAVVRIDLPVGYDHYAPGLAELAAMAVSDAPDPRGNRPSLRELIARLGGNFDVDVGATWTRFSAAVPGDRWEEGLRYMAERMQQLSVDRAALRNVQARLIRSYRAQWESNLLIGQAELWLRHGARTRTAVVESIEDHSLVDVVRFHRRHYQPRNVSVGVWVPGMPTESTAVFESTKGALLAWRLAPALGKAQGPELDAVPSPTGVQWVEGTKDRSHVALLLPLSPDTLESWTLLECLVTPVRSGRLGQFLALRLGREPVFRVRELGSHDRRYLVLETEVLPIEVPRIWQALRVAIASLSDKPPAGSELARAIVRVRDRLLRRQDQPDDWFEAVQKRLLRKQKGGPRDDLRALKRITTKSLADAATAWTERPIAMVVAGGAVPVGAGDDFVKVEVEFPEGDLPAGVDDATSEKRAEPFLKLAMQALGSKRDLGLYRGFELNETWRTADRLDVEASTTFRFPDRLDRTTKLLGTTIVTEIEGAKGRERVGDKVGKLPAEQAADVLREATTHPITLVAVIAMEKARYRLVGLRTRRGRRVALLELIDAARPRLRITVDTRSGLLRSVETMRHRAESHPMRVRSYYDDYRKTGGLRVPMHRVTTVGDQAESVDSVVHSFRILAK